VGFFDKLGKRDEDKPKADFSNVQSGSSTTSAEPAAPAPDLPSPVGTTGQTYVVVAGDSLSKIAKRHYGDANKWHRIYEANRDQIKNPDLIHPGQQLKIPGA
jgi:nucleoid-associated protein YgaU